jgi:hypothetical protein
MLSCTSMVTTQATYGFLYLEYGPTAWWWEVEELVRKLLLSSLVVLIDAGSPLQVRLQYVWPRAVLCVQDATIPHSVKPDVAHGTDSPVCILERASLACMRSITHIGSLSLPQPKLCLTLPSRQVEALLCVLSTDGAPIPLLWETHAHAHTVFWAVD